MNLPNEIKATFNRNIVLGVGILRVYKDGVLFITFTESDITVTDNYFVINTTNMFPDNGYYYILFDEGLITSVFGENYSLMSSDIWNFTIASGDYSATHYSNDYFIT